MENHKKKLGAEGEEAAVQYLISKGYEIVGRNVHMSHDEIDIIARHSSMLIFVEVKTRATNNYGVPEDFITPQKEACMIRAAEAYIFETDYNGESRFDVVAIHYAGKKPVLHHIEDAFYSRA